MIEDGKTFLHLSVEDIEVGLPLRWPIYNGDRVQIFREGAVIQTRAELEEAFRKGGYRLILKQEEVPGVAVTEAKPLTAGGGRIERPMPVAAANESAGRSAKLREVAFETSRIQVGDQVQLQTTDDKPQRYIVRLIGYSKNQGVIVSPPESNGAMIMLREGQALVGRFFCGHSAYAFSCAVTRMTSVPYPHLHLSYPRQISLQEVRKSPRVDLDLIVALSLASGRGEAAGRMIDLSITGAGLRTKVEIAEKGDVLLIKFKLVVQGLETVLALRAEVCAIRKLDDPTMPFFYGVHFCDLDPSAQFALTAYVYGRLLGHQ